jgi:5-methylcytosine-specific restriction endonuclease McrA
MDQLLRERGTEASVRSHFQSLKTLHDLPVTRGQDDKYRFNREHLGLSDARDGSNLVRESATHEEGTGTPFDQVWKQLQAGLARQPRCPEHPEFPCVNTLSEGVRNDVLAVGEDGVRLRSHRSGNERLIPVRCFRTWWTYLARHGEASLVPGAPDNPDRQNSKVVGAIWVRCLPNLVRSVGTDRIALAPVRPLDDPLPEEVTESAGLVEGAVRTVVVNAYERNPEARRRCVAHYGPRCAVCGFDFAAAYGAVAEGYIHVHHLRPLAEIGEAYVVDPVADLRPVCPNCHAVIHLGGGCRGIEDVRRLLAAARSG